MAEEEKVDKTAEETAAEQQKPADIPDAPETSAEEAPQPEQPERRRRQPSARR